MEKNLQRGEIIVSGLVQGVGFRYFIVRTALNLGIKGYAKNLYSGEVLTVAEGERYLLEEFFDKIKIGPRYADVRKAVINWSEYKNEFKTFEIID
jgi:acylphosphatase